MVSGIDTGLSAASLTGAWALLRKDAAVFILRDRLIFGVVFLLAALQTALVDEAFLWLGVVFSASLALYVPALEWHQETDPMLSSLPVSRGVLVLARYVSAVVAGAVGGVAWTTAGRLLAPVLAPGRATSGIWVTMDGALTFILLFGLLLAFFLPLYFRLGLGWGSLVFMGTSVGLMVLSSLVLDNSSLAGWAGSERAGGLVLPGAAIRGRMAELAGSIGPGWALFAILGGVGVCLALSGGISARWYKRRDL